ncbi:MAG: hypothetical protein KGL35_02595 [Bradyrhizobium sp.]|nr:hypothetical protein [Bradyrhizobium sp.]
MPKAIAIIVAARLASYVELGTVLGAEDLYDLIEIMSVDAHNRRPED